MSSSPILNPEKESRIRAAAVLCAMLLAGLA